MERDRAALQDHCRVRRHRRHHRRTRYGRSAWSFRRCASCSASRDDCPVQPLLEAPGPHANRPPDGDRGMRRGGARHRARATIGRRVPLEELRVTCGVSREGSKPATSFGRRSSYGLDAVGMRREVDEVLAGPFPVIVLLERQPVPGRRGRLRQQGLPQRSGDGTAQRLARGVRRRVSQACRWSSRRGPTFAPGGASPGLMAKLAAPPEGLQRRRSPSSPGSA